MARLRQKTSGRGGLTEAQHEFLLYGELWLTDSDGRVFENEATELLAWAANRDRLIQEFASTRRLPFAYFKFELLDRIVRGNINDSEAKLFEESFDFCNPRQNPGLCSVYLDEDYTRERAADGANLPELLKECRIATRWHEFRNRPELTQKYQSIASVSEKVIQQRGKSTNG